jgi:putative transposase
MTTVPEMGRTLQTVFGEKAKQIAQQTGLVKRASKLTGSLFLVVLVCGFLENPSASYAYLVEFAYDLGLEITRQGLQERIVQGEGLAFMKQMFSVVLESFKSKLGVDVALLNRFPAVYLHDSTCLLLPNKLAELYPSTNQGKARGSKAGLKLQVTWDWLHNQIAKLSVHAGKESDAGHKLDLEGLPKGSLIMFDLGYSGLEIFKRIIEHKMWWISRFDLKCCVYLPQGLSEFNLLSHVRKSKETWTDLELEVGKKVRLPSRVIVVRLPKAVAEERLRKGNATAKRCGYKMSAAKREWLEYNLYFTNLSAAEMSSSQVALLYGTRWQIELVFKLSKSEMELDHILGRSEARVLVEIYAKLIGLILFYYLTAPLRISEIRVGEEKRDNEISYVRTIQTYKRRALELGRGLLGQKELTEVLEELREVWERFGKRDTRRKRKSTFQQLGQEQPFAGCEEKKEELSA